MSPPCRRVPRRGCRGRCPAARTTCKPPRIQGTPRALCRCSPTRPSRRGGRCSSPTRGGQARSAQGGHRASARPPRPGRAGHHPAEERHILYRLRCRPHRTGHITRTILVLQARETPPAIKGLSRAREQVVSSSIAPKPLWRRCSRRVPVRGVGVGASPPVTAPDRSPAPSQWSRPRPFYEPLMVEGPSSARRTHRRSRGCRACLPSPRPFGVRERTAPSSIG